MSHRLIGVPAGLAVLALSASVAHAATQTVTDPAAGLSQVRLSDQDAAGKLTLTLTPTDAEGFFNALFIDLDGDGRSDRAVVAFNDGDGFQAGLIATPESTTECQQVDGDTVTDVEGVTSALAADGKSWTMTIPGTAVTGDFDWAALGEFPGLDSFCGNTEGTVFGVATTFASARRFSSGVVKPPTDTTAPAAPGGLSGAAGDGAIGLDWADNAETDVAGYLVYRRVAGGSPTLVAEPTSSVLIDRGLINGTTYEYYVRAKDKAGNLSPASAKVTLTPKKQVATPPITTVPGPTATTAVVARTPKKPRATHVGARRVTLDWPTVKGATRYRVYRRRAHRAWPKTALATVRTSAFNDRTVKPATSYEYRVVGITATGKRSTASKSIAVHTKRKAAR